MIYLEGMFRSRCSGPTIFEASPSCVLYFRYLGVIQVLLARSFLIVSIR